MHINVVERKRVRMRREVCGCSCAACGKVVARPDGLLSHWLARAHHPDLPSGAIRHREYARLLCCGHEARLHTTFICELPPASHGMWQMLAATPKDSPHRVTRKRRASHYRVRLPTNALQ